MIRIWFGKVAASPSRSGPQSLNGGAPHGPLHRDAEAQGRPAEDGRERPSIVTCLKCSNRLFILIIVFKMIIIINIKRKQKTLFSI